MKKKWKLYHKFRWEVENGENPTRSPYEGDMSDAWIFRAAEFPEIKGLMSLKITTRM